MSGGDESEPRIHAPFDAQWARMWSVFEGAPAAVAVGHGVEHWIDVTNRRFREAIGPTRRVIGRTAREAFPELASQGFIDVLDKVYASGEPFFGSEMLVRLDREQNGELADTYYNFLLQPILGPSGEVEGIMVCGVDITTQVAARQQALVAQLRHADLIDTLRAIAWEGEISSRRLTFVSRRAEELFGHPLSQWNDFYFWLGLIHPDDRQDVVRTVEAAIRDRRHLELEFRMLTADGRVVWVRNNIEHVLDEHGQSKGLRGVMIDISERRRAELEREQTRAQLVQTQKWESLGVLAGGIAHDFNNLLTSVLGNASLALLGIPEGLPARALVEDILSSARRASELTRQLLAYSGRARLEAMAIDLNRTLEETVPLLQAALPAQVSLRLQPESGLPPVGADPDQLKQVLLNLVINAGEAIGRREGVVRIRTGRAELDARAVSRLAGGEALRPGSYVFVSIEDSGEGMDEATKEKLFDPFYSTKATGRGLGLATVLGVIRGHGGGIAVESQPEQGTSFQLHFPVEHALAPQPADLPVARRGTLQSDLVLVIDDEPWVRATTRRMLEHLGYAVLEAEDGPNGLSLFEERARDIAAVLLDLTMPRMDGEEVLHELQQIRPSVPVVVSSGYTGSETARQIARGNTVSFLEKPYTVQQLGEVLAGLLPPSK
ncbi:MAG: response regulator [Deltaproteobacteria bacterium]|nr:response regulator [Deltaproteobacteria bacterium]